MNIAATLLLMGLPGCFGIPNYPDEAFGPLFEVTGYPKIGDVPTLNRKIFKGVRVAIREHPYIVSIRRQFVHYVTGTLITSTLVLTVAHPLYQVPIQELGVVVGENYADRGTMLHSVILLVIHENFDPYTLHHDIAMLKIYEDCNIRSSVKTIDLLSSLPLNGTKAFVTGWGRCDRTGKELCLPRGSIYYPGEKLDPMLRTVMVEINLPNYFCDGYERQDITLHPGMLCVGESREENPVAPCLAVPGAPLVVRGHLAGLQSWGFGCGFSHDLPLVYTNTVFYEQWILHNLKLFNSLTTVNYTELFDVTKAYILYSWLAETRHAKPFLSDNFPAQLQPAAIDTVLLHLKGDYYDIRDFIDNGKYHESKLNMINVLWNRERKLALINDTKVKRPAGEPFIRNYLEANDNDGEDDEESS